jgi:flagellin
VLIGTTAWSGGTASPFASASSTTQASATATGANVSVLAATGSSGGTAQVSGVGAGYAAMLTQLDAAERLVTGASAAFGSSQSRIELQQTFVDSLVTTLKGSVSSMVDADMPTESARLSALQTQQSLGTQALSIANTSTQGILQLFR